METQLPKRKATRLDGYDYSACGAYFITLCTQDRRCILSRIVGEGSPLPQLSHYGEIADKWITRISQKHNTIEVDRYVIMPNHIHLLLSIHKNNGRGNPSPTITNVIAWLKYQITKEINQSKGKSGEKIFQRSFHDHIVRNYDDYNHILKYISENPLKWELNKLYVRE